MSETLCRTMRRFAPAIVTPAVNASFTAQSNPYSSNATKIESNVRMVRVFFLLRLLQTSAKYFMRRSLFYGFVAQFALIQMHRSGGASRSVRVVCNHDDSFSMLAIERLKQIEDFIARL